jgi:hypothetical protein
MASGTFKWYAGFFSALANKEIDLVGTPDTVKVMALATAYTADQDAHDYVNDVNANEVTGTNLSAGGFTADTVTFSYTSGTNTWKLDHADESISTVTASDIKHMAWYVETAGAASTDPLIGYVTWDTALSPSAGTLAVNLDSAGLGTLTIS